MHSNKPSIVQSLFPQAVLDHVGVALPPRSALATTLQQLLPYNLSDPKDLASHGVGVEFLTPKADNPPVDSVTLPELELISPLDSHSSLEKFLEKNPNGGIHHLCFAVGNLDEAISLLRKAGHDITAPARTGAHGKKVIFIHPKTTKGILIELCE